MAKKKDKPIIKTELQNLLDSPPFPDIHEFDNTDNPGLLSDLVEGYYEGYFNENSPNRNANYYKAAYKAALRIYDDNPEWQIRSIPEPKSFNEPTEEDFILLKKCFVEANNAWLATKKTPNLGDKPLVEIDLNDFSNVSGTRLLSDLISFPEGISYNEKLHGNNQPKSLKQTLHGKYPEVAKDIRIKKNKIYLKTLRLVRKA
jgi:hypothetical protein